MFVGLRGAVRAALPRGPHCCTPPRPWSAPLPHESHSAPRFPVPDLTWPACAPLCRPAMWWSTGTTRGSLCSRWPTTARYHAWLVHYDFPSALLPVGSEHGRLLDGVIRCQSLGQLCNYADCSGTVLIKCYILCALANLASIGAITLCFTL
jgi:hypothetical protein